MTTLLFGGTFDPVHNGHITMLRAARESIKPDSTIILPVGSPWQKGRQPFVSAEDRLQMLHLAFQDLDGVTMDDRELRREGATYTVDTLTELRALYPAEQFFWLLGSDSFAKLHTWHRADALVKLAAFAVVRRAGEIIVPPMIGHVAVRFTEIICAPPPISSTSIRAAIAENKTIQHFVPEAVCDYIALNHLYQSNPS